MKIHIKRGGAIYRVNTYGREFLIEMHPYCGPMLVDEDFNAIEGRRPRGFWQAVEAIGKMTPYRLQLIEVV